MNTKTKVAAGVLALALFIKFSHAAIQRGEAYAKVSPATVPSYLKHAFEKCGTAQCQIDAIKEYKKAERTASDIGDAAFVKDLLSWGMEMSSR